MVPRTSLGSRCAQNERWQPCASRLTLQSIVPESTIPHYCLLKVERKQSITLSYVAPFPKFSNDRTYLFHVRAILTSLLCDQNYESLYEFIRVFGKCTVSRPIFSISHLFISLVAANERAFLTPSAFSAPLVAANMLDDAAGRRVFSGISCSPRPFIPALLHIHLASPSLALSFSLSQDPYVKSRPKLPTPLLSDTSSAQNVHLVPECPHEHVTSLIVEHVQILEESHVSADDLVPLPSEALLGSELEGMRDWNRPATMLRLHLTPMLYPVCEDDHEESMDENEHEDSDSAEYDDDGDFLDAPTHPSNTQALQQFLAMPRFYALPNIIIIIIIIIYDVDGDKCPNFSPRMSHLKPNQSSEVETREEMGYGLHGSIQVGRDPPTLTIRHSRTTLSFRAGCKLTRGRGGGVDRLLASHLDEPGSIPGGVTPEFSHVGIVPDDAAGRRDFSGITTSLHTHPTSHPSALKTSLLRCRPYRSLGFLVLEAWFRPTINSRVKLFTHPKKNCGDPRRDLPSAEFSKSAFSALAYGPCPEDSKPQCRAACRGAISIIIGCSRATKVQRPKAEVRTARSAAAHFSYNYSPDFCRQSLTFAAPFLATLQTFPTQAIPRESRLADRTGIFVLNNPWFLPRMSCLPETGVSYSVRLRLIPGPGDVTEIPGVSNNMAEKGRVELDPSVETLVGQLYGAVIMSGWRRTGRKRT
ncbi:hypothetical protein PR048_014991 [Dryococelus australis]|uniref:Uncharacterized protein n=1 Tax=Dryococelus australis TaxID=614101 RepID=A0ABQ9HFQ8_9NEOP|nr:hypothetical protein PR048_014991 [Dryococelus australis]